MASSRARPSVVGSLVNEYSALASITSFTDHELKAIFSKSEMAAINTLLADMRAATTENQKRARLVRNINKYADVLLKIVRKLGGVPI